MNETSNKLRIFIINMAAQSLGELQESEIISKVNDTVENMLDLFFVGKAALDHFVDGMGVLRVGKVI